MKWKSPWVEGLVSIAGPVPAAPAVHADPGTGRTAPGRLSRTRTPETAQALTGRRNERGAPGHTAEDEPD